MVVIPLTAHRFALGGQQNFAGPAHVPIKMFLEQLFLTGGIFPEFGEGAEKVVIWMNFQKYLQISGGLLQ